MAGPHLEVETVLRTLFRRCVLCPPVTPSCHSCPAGQTCSLSSQSCTQCPSMACISIDTSGPSAVNANLSKSSGPNVGAIAGGIVGGVVLVAIVTGLIWRFCIKARRRRYEQEDEEEDERAEAESSNEKSNRASARRGDRASMHTVGSTASTVFTRASNLIQIAYIPGVTNRSPPSTPGLLVPPVPPLPPGAGSQSSHSISSPGPHPDQHFFMPELRASTYSGLSEATFARDSMAPSLGRSSVATTIYRHNAIVNPVPVQTGIRGKAAVVSVKSSSQNSPNESPTSTPPVPTVDYERYGASNGPVKPTSDADHRRPPPSPAFSVGSTFFRSTADTAKAAVARPVSVRRPSKPSQTAQGDRQIADSILAATSMAQKIDPRASLSPSPSAASKHSRARRHDAMPINLDEISDEDEPGARARKSLMGPQRDSAQTVIEDNTPIGHQSPFSDTHAVPASPELPSAHKGRRLSSTGSRERIPSVDYTGRSVSNPVGHQHVGSLSTVIEDAARRASRQPNHGGLGSNVARDPSPFSDANEARTP